MRKQRIGLHKIALAALFTVGNTLIRYPWRQGGQQAVVLLLASAAVAVATVLFLYPLFRKIWRSPMSGRPFRSYAVAVLSVLLGAYALLCAWRSCWDYVEFSTRLVLPQGSKILLAAVFLMCVGWLASLSARGMDCFSLPAFLGVTVCILILFAVGVGHFRWSDGIADLLQWDRSVLTLLLTMWRESVLPLSVLALYFALTVPSEGARVMAVGVGIGCVLPLFCVVQGILTFGASYAAELEYPYSFAVRILSVGQYFFRLEGFSYVVDYLSCLTRCAICVATVRRLAMRFSPKSGRWVSVAACALLFAFSLFQ